jgi:hypothetical protein
VIEVHEAMADVSKSKKIAALSQNGQTPKGKDFSDSTGDGNSDFPLKVTMKENITCVRCDPFKNFFYVSTSRGLLTKFFISKQTSSDIDQNLLEETMDLIGLEPKKTDYYELIETGDIKNPIYDTGAPDDRGCQIELYFPERIQEFENGNKKITKKFRKKLDWTLAELNWRELAGKMDEKSEEKRFNVLRDLDSEATGNLSGKMERGEYVLPKKKSKKAKPQGKIGPSSAYLRKKSKKTDSPALEYFIILFCQGSVSLYSKDL